MELHTVTGLAKNVCFFRVALPSIFVSTTMGIIDFAIGVNDVVNLLGGSQTVPSSLVTVLRCAVCKQSVVCVGEVVTRTALVSLDCMTIQLASHAWLLSH